MLEIFKEKDGIKNVKKKQDTTKYMRQIWKTTTTTTTNQTNQSLWKQTYLLKLKIR